MGRAEIFHILGRRVELPVEVRDATSGSASYLVSASAARGLLPGPEIDVVEILPGRALLSIAFVDYRDNDLGDYNEVSIAFFVRPRGESASLPIPYLGNAIDLLRSRLGTYIHHLPVDQEFTCEAGRSIWGFPKTVQKIDIHYGPDRVSCSLVYGGQHAFSLSVPRGGTRRLPDTELETYTFIEGVAHRTQFRSGAEGFGVRLGGAEITLGSGPLAEELRQLGLPRSALMTTFMERMHGRFGPAVKL